MKFRFLILEVEEERRGIVLQIFNGYCIIVIEQENIYSLNKYLRSLYN